MAKPIPQLRGPRYGINAGHDDGIRPICRHLGESWTGVLCFPPHPRSGEKWGPNELSEHAKNRQGYAQFLRPRRGKVAAVVTLVWSVPGALPRAGGLLASSAGPAGEPMNAAWRPSPHMAAGSRHALGLPSVAPRKARTALCPGEIGAWLTLRLSLTTYTQKGRLLQQPCALRPWRHIGLINTAAQLAEARPHR